MIRTEMSGEELDRVLSSLAAVQTSRNNGQVLYIYRGELETTAPENLFDIIDPEEEGG